MPRSSPPPRSSNLDRKVYVGDLGNDADAQELEDAFGEFGTLRKVWVARRPPGFAFVEFEDGRDAEAACRALDGKTLCGRRVRVELSSGRSRWPQGAPPLDLLRREAPRYLPEGRGRRRSRSKSRSPARRHNPSPRRPSKRRSYSRSESRSRSYSPEYQRGRR